jgi:hypothetical protein
VDRLLAGFGSFESFWTVRASWKQIRFTSKIQELWLIELSIRNN